MRVLLQELPGVKQGPSARLDRAAFLTRPFAAMPPAKLVSADWRKRMAAAWAKIGYNNVEQARASFDSSRKGAFAYTW